MSPRGEVRYWVKKSPVAPFLRMTAPEYRWWRHWHNHRVSIADPNPFPRVRLFRRRR